MPVPAKSNDALWPIDIKGERSPSGACQPTLLTFNGNLGWYYAVLSVLFLKLRHPMLFHCLVFRAG